MNKSCLPELIELIGLIAQHHKKTGKKSSAFAGSGMWGLESGKFEVVSSGGAAYSCSVLRTADWLRHER
jgi:hypothetical protein